MILLTAGFHVVVIESVRIGQVVAVQSAPSKCLISMQALLEKSRVAIDM